MLKTKSSQKSYFSRPRKSRGFKKFALLIILPLFVIGAILLVLEKTGVTNFYAGENDSSGDNAETINYDPPNEEEKQAGNDQKDKVLEDEEARNDPVNQNKQNATVIITDAAQYDDIIEVRSFIPDYYQDGTCTITFTKDNQKVEKSTPAYRDVSTTICTNPNFNRTEFPSGGDWQVVVSYSSTGAKGQSSTQTVTIN